MKFTEAKPFLFRLRMINRGNHLEMGRLLKLGWRCVMCCLMRRAPANGGPELKVDECESVTSARWLKSPIMSYLWALKLNQKQVEASNQIITERVQLQHKKILQLRRENSCQQFAPSCSALHNWASVFIKVPSLIIFPHHSGSFIPDIS